jgi:hypothetical protein
MLVNMYGDLPEDFRNMRDRREGYNRPLRLKRSEMGIRDVESEKEKVGPTGAPTKAGFDQPGSKGAELSGLGAETITSGGSAVPADPPGTGLRGLEVEAEGRPSLNSTIGPSSGLKPTRPSDRNLANIRATSGSVKNVSGEVCWSMT